MKKTYKLLIVSILTFTFSYAQSIQSPSQFLGYELGSRFTRHHKVVDYFNYISSNLQTLRLKNMVKLMSIDHCMYRLFLLRKTLKI
jgi:hypothetical protein